MVPPIPELTSGRKVKGTETRGHTMKEICRYFPDDRQININYACRTQKTRLRTLAGTWWVPRIGLHECWDAARVMLTKALPALSLPTFSPILFPSPSSQITQHTQTHTHTHTHTLTRTHTHTHTFLYISRHQCYNPMHILPQNH